MCNILVFSQAIKTTLAGYLVLPVHTSGAGCVVVQSRVRVGEESLLLPWSRFQPADKPTGLPAMADEAASLHVSHCVCVVVGLCLC